MTVPQITIDQYVEKQGIKSVNLIKLDIEGAKPEAIAGMLLLLNDNDAPDILCELNTWILERRGLDSTAITLPLAAIGYRLFPIDNSAPNELDPSIPVSGLTDIHCRKC